MISSSVWLVNVEAVILRENVFLQLMNCVAHHFRQEVSVFWDGIHQGKSEGWTDTWLIHRIADGSFAVPGFPLPVSCFTDLIIAKDG